MRTKTVPRMPQKATFQINVQAVFFQEGLPDLITEQKIC